MLTVVSFKWGTKYSADYVIRQAAAVRRNLTIPHRYVCITDDQRKLHKHVDACWTIDDLDLLAVRDGCYVRLRLFDLQWQKQHNIEQVVCLDLDVVVVGSLDTLFSRSEDVVLLRGGHFNPCPYNGSVQMVTAGAHAEVWDTFNVAEAEQVALASGRHLGTDQTWLAHKLPKAASWTYRDGIYGFKKPGWPDGDALPADARLVSFAGRRDPISFQYLDWVRMNWR